MTPNPNLQDSAQLSSIGNVVTVGIRLYFLRFKQYVKLALAAHLWLLIPIYGWTKFFSISALMAQLAFHDLVNQPDEMFLLQQQLRHQKWKIFLTNILAVLIVLLAGILAVIAIILFFAIFFFVIPGLLSVPVSIKFAQPFSDPIALAVGLIENLFWILAALWVYSRFFIVELPLVLECDFKPIKSIKRCLKLTKGSALFIVGVIALSFLLTFLPSYLMANVLGTNILRFFLKLVISDYSTGSKIFHSLLVVLSLLTNAVTMPLWQTVKATLYYSLRSRREGIDLQLRDRNASS
jgi:hypothetical protein